MSARSLALALSWLAAWVLSGAAQAAAPVGQPAPELTGRDTRGNLVKLSALRGRHVVIEWTNPNCPFVRKHYVSDNLPALQREFTARGVVWLAVNSTRTDHVDYLAPPQLDTWLTQSRAAPSALLMDENGSQGRLWGARTTPHLYIVDPKGTVVYAGAIDSLASASAGDIARATNHVRAGLTESLAGKAVTTPSTTPYGCSIKYASAAAG
ncbi:MAG: redoxin domain-containing protein [Burkholderiaceae bacterium]|nr:redoxin domain-containing protein [Burkholderiaceae bacterium]